MLNKVLVIGAGIVGVSTALRLQRRGCKVTLVDPKPPGKEASFGNAGLIAQGYCVPNAHPGLFKHIPSMLLDPAGPLSLNWSGLATTAPWLLRFVREATKDRSDANGKNLHAISRLATDGWRDLIEGTNLDHFLRDTGWLHVFEQQKSVSAFRQEQAHMASLGIDINMLSADEVADLEPGLERCFAGGALQNNALSLSSPYLMISGLVSAFVNAGGTVVEDKILSADMDPTGKTGLSVQSAQRTYFADTFVLTAGAWSKSLSVIWGAKRSLPLIAERGYHIMLPQPKTQLFTRPISFGERSFLLCPMVDGIRITGQVELSPIEAPPHYAMQRRLLPFVKQFAPSLLTQEQSIWMGNRPSLPDSLPVIGRSPKASNVIFGFGHQHLGMTLGPITARLIEQLVFNQDTEIPLDPYRAERF